MSAPVGNQPDPWTRGRSPRTLGEVTTATPTLHVVAASRGGWLVVDEDRAPLSEHSDASAAVRAAGAELRARDGGELVVHDRYHRVRARRFVPAPR
jgi:hypothetical protein